MKARSPLRAVTRLVSILAVLVSALAISGTAYADDPPPGNQGCIGSPEIPKAFVCVVSLTPENAVPAVGTTVLFYQHVPVMCYYTGCTDPMEVPVPGPTVTTNPGSIAVIYYDGRNYAIPVPEVGPGVLYDALSLVFGVAQGVVDEADRLVTEATDAAKAAVHEVAVTLVNVLITARDQSARTFAKARATYINLLSQVQFNCAGQLAQVCAAAFGAPIVAIDTADAAVRDGANLLIDILSQY